MKVAIIHPWLPQYRVNFFKELISRGVKHGIEFKIFYGDTPPEWKKREDAGIPQGFIRLDTRFLSFRGRTLNHKSLAPIESFGPFDLIIVEQAVRNLETYNLLLRREPLAFWGHGRTFTQSVSRHQDRFKQWLTRKGKWFFAYTLGGADAMIEAGMPREQITVVQNSIDTKSLQQEISNVSAEELEMFREDHNLRGKTALFIGGLDDSKRIPFLFEAAEIAASLDSDFKLLVAGAGDSRALVERESAAKSYITYLGPLFGAKKAIAIAAAQVMAMPGRVGLVAVDSFAGLTPIVTTRWKWHSVEFEYLEPDKNAVITEDDVEAYALGLVRTLQDDLLINKLRAFCAESRDHYTLDAMVDNFIFGVVSALKGANN